MNTVKSNRGFKRIVHHKYLDPKQETSIVYESSAIGNDNDAFENPGSSYLFIGDCHLNRKQVKQLADALNYWLDNKRLPDI